MNKILFFVFLLVSCVNYSQKNTTISFSIFSKLEYDKVVCYECDITKEGFIVMNDSETVYRKIIKNSKEMNKSQIDTLHSKFTFKVEQTNEMFSGKDPYFQDMAFVYYYKNRIVAYYDIPRSGNLFDIWLVRVKKNRKIFSSYRVRFKETEREQLSFICSELFLKCGK